MPTAQPFLTFQPSKGHSAETAMRFYLDVFGGELRTLTKHPDGSPGAGSVLLAEFVVAGLPIRCSDSYVEHAWDFTPATSLWIACSSDQEQQRFFDALSVRGRVHMPLDDYGFGRFAWVDDQFGVSWQLGRD